jgi:uncharacterized membrane protein
VETLYFDVLQFFYLLALALIVGGAIVLGSAVAPAVFRSARTRGEGGLLFGAILARYDQLATYALFILVVTAVLRFIGFEETAIGPRLIARWIALAVLALAILYGSAWSNPVARTLRAQTKDFDELPENHPVRVEFAKLHRSSRRAMRVAVLSGLAALFLS